MTQPTNRLYRSRSERMIGGVCAGLGHFFGIDPTIVRLVFVLSLFLWPGPFSPLIYLVLLFIVPEEPIYSATSNRQEPVVPPAPAQPVEPVEPVEPVDFVDPLPPSENE